MENIKGFLNCNILTPDGFKKTNLIIENGLIKEIGDKKTDGLMELDDSLFVVPGFIDEHIHGAMGSDAMDGTKEDLEKIACAIAKEGTTAFCATTMTQSRENITKSLKAVNEYIKLDNKKGV